MGKRYTKNRKGCRKENILETKENKDELASALHEMEEKMKEEIVETKTVEETTEKTMDDSASTSATDLEKIEEENVEESKEPITEEKTLEKIEEALNGTEDEVKESTEEEKNEARNGAEKIAEKYKDTENFSMKDIIYLMKNSGMSYKQISQRMKQIADATEEYAKTQGPDFDRREFLKKQMEEKLGKK